MGLNVAVTPAGSPLALNVGRVVRVDWRVAVMVLVTLAPGLTVRLVGLTAIAKSETKPATVSWTPSVWVTPPPVPVTVIVETLLDTELDADSRTNVLVPDGAGMSVAVTPAGSPLTLSVTPAVNPPLGVTVTVVPADWPAERSTEGGLADSEKSGPAASAAPGARPAPTRAVARTSSDSSLIPSIFDLPPSGAPR